MRITTTDGQEYITPDMCGYCEMDTGGEHQANCPCYQSLGEQMVNDPTFNILTGKQYRVVAGRLYMVRPDSPPKWGYQDMAKENLRLAEEAMPSTLEVWPKWDD